MTQEVKQRRVQSNYQPENARFLLDCDFSKQYDRYYRKRLEKTRPFLEYNCHLKWDPNTPIYNLSEVATFAPTNETLDSEANSFASSSPEPTDEPFCNYKLKKRLRKFSGSQTTASGDRKQQPQTSTQNPKERQADESLFSDDDIEFTSPILGAQRVHGVVSPTVRRPAGSKTAECIVIGTIFKRMRLQPDVVDELSKGNFHVKCEKYLGHYTSQDDTLVLEDCEESIQLVGKINPKHLVTGVVVALLGVSIDDGSQFMVFDICFAEPNRELLYDDLQPFPPERLLASRRPCYLMIVSDLGFHYEMDKRVELTRALQNLIDFIWGGAKYSDDPRSSLVTRILVAGNSLHEDRFSEDEDELLAQAKAAGQDEIMFKMKQSRQVKQYTKTIQASKHMDDFYAQLSKTIHVDVMPGPSDPSSHLMPQQPFHPCMFPQSCMFSTFNCTTNPHHAIYNDNVEILTTAGQNVDIIKKFSDIKNSIDVMKCHLMWGNSAPSAPDNLYSVPYEDEDPFVIDFIPDVYVAGCQDEYKREFYRYTSTDPILENRRSNSSSVSKNKSVYQARPSSPSLFTTPAERASSSTPTMSSKLDESAATESGARKERTLLLTVPRFFETFSCVLLDLVTLESQLVLLDK